MRLAKILVPIDGSAYADYGLNIAMRIAELYSSRVDLLNVREPAAAFVPTRAIDPVIGGTVLVIPSEVLPEQAKKEIDAEKKEADDLLEDRLNLLREKKIEGGKILSETPDFSGEILRIAHSGGYDLVVVGSRGLSGIKSVILGSVSTKVAKEAKCSVLVMKQKVEGAPKMLLGYDGSDESKKALEYACDLGKKLGAEVDPMTVVNLPATAEGLVGVDVDRWEKEMNEQLDEAIKTLESAGIPAKRKMIEFMDAAKALTDEAEKENYGLIVVGNRGLGRLKSLFLGSVASGVANNSKTNVWIVR